MKYLRFLLLWPFSIWTNTSSLFNLKLGLVIIKILACIELFNIMYGCFYYKATTTSFPETNVISSLKNSNKEFVIHSGTRAFIINIIKIDNDSIKGYYVADYVFPVMNKTFPKVNSSHRYRKSRGEERITNEVHFYLFATNLAVNNIISFAQKDIYRCDIYNPDKLSTALSWGCGITGGVAIAIPLILILLLIVGTLIGGLISCPYIYVNNGQEFVFAGEIYSGAIYSPLERNDYLALPQLVPVNGNYMLKISNELREIEHTNLTELIVIDHPAKLKVLLDKYGNYQTVTEIMPPLTALNLIGTDILNIVKNKDTLVYYGEPPKKDKEIALTDGIIMTYHIPPDTKSGKLFIRARNSVWLENVYKNFHGLLGSYNDAWTKKQNGSDAAKLKEWPLSQKIPLSIYVEKNGEWVFCDYFNMVGPMALKEDVISIDLKGIEKGPLKIKLESGSYFWEIDYVGIDFSKNIPLQSSTIKISNAITEKGDNITDLLKNDDLNYYIQSETNNVADLSFTVPAFTNSERTIILHSKGFYQEMQETAGLPQIKKLKAIKAPGQFLEYSRELMKSEIDYLYKN